MSSDNSDVLNELSNLRTQLRSIEKSVKAIAEKVGVPATPAAAKTKTVKKSRTLRQMSDDSRGRR